MTTAFARATTAAIDTLRTVAGVPVTYARGADTVDLIAIPGDSRVTVADESGAQVEASVRDWIVRTGDLVLAATPVEPDRGDTLSETRAGLTYTWEVLPLLGESAHRMSDRDGYAWRIHTKLANVEVTP